MGSQDGDRDKHLVEKEILVKGFKGELTEIQTIKKDFAFQVVTLDSYDFRRITQVIGWIGGSAMKTKREDVILFRGEFDFFYMGDTPFLRDKLKVNFGIKGLKQIFVE